MSYLSFVIFTQSHALQVIDFTALFVAAQGETSENLRAMDKRMSDLGLDGGGSCFCVVFMS